MERVGQRHPQEIGTAQSAPLSPKSTEQPDTSIARYRCAVWSSIRLVRVEDGLQSYVAAQLNLDRLGGTGPAGDLGLVRDENRVADSDLDALCRES